MTVYFGSDYHFEHKNILSFCNRPYVDLDEMQDKMIEEYHDRLSPGDVVYLLGDIQFCNHTDYLQKLCKNKRVEVHLIHGNHDSKRTRNYEGWRSSQSYKDIKVDNTRISLFHYPISEWNRKDHGSIHLHGHTHGLMSHKAEYIPKRLDVGYDNTGQVLISFDEVITRITQDMLDDKRRRIDE